MGDGSFALIVAQGRVFNPNQTYDYYDPIRGSTNTLFYNFPQRHEDGAASDGNGAVAIAQPIGPFAVRISLLGAYTVANLQARQI